MNTTEEKSDEMDEEQLTNFFVEEVGGFIRSESGDEEKAKRFKNILLLGPSSVFVVDYISDLYFDLKENRAYLTKEDFRRIAHAFTIGFMNGYQLGEDDLALRIAEATEGILERVVS